jgi:hypothetical protein
MAYTSWSNATQEVHVNGSLVSAAAASHASERSRRCSPPPLPAGESAGEAAAARAR